MCLGRPPGDSFFNRGCLQAPASSQHVTQTAPRVGDLNCLAAGVVLDHGRKL